MSELTTEDFIWQLKNSKDPDERLYAAFKLGREREKIVVQPLIDAVHDADIAVRARVIEALGTRIEPEVVPPLIHALKDADVLVRRTAAKSLGYIKDTRAVAPLCDLLNDADETVRSQVAEALGHIPSSAAAEPLVALFLHDKDANVRYFAKQSLSTIGTPTVVEALLDSLKNETDLDAIVDVIEVLGLIGDSRAENALKALAAHEDDGIQKMAEWALKSLK